MNRPPVEVAARVEPGALRAFIAQVCRKLGMDEEHASLLAELLVLNDLRGVVSHGSRLIHNYARLLQTGSLNPRPRLRVEAQTPSTVIVDGDGGLGYFPAYRAAHLLVDMARAQGVAAAVTRNHGHIGAAGLYSRIPAAHDLICYGTSGHQLHLEPGHTIMRAAGGSPMTFAVPTGSEPPVVLDFGTVHDLHSRKDGRFDRLLEMAPGLVFRSLGLGVMCQALGGVLAGVPIDPARATYQYPGAYQGSLFIALDVARFMPLDVFKREMDEYVRRAHELEPLNGYRSYLPGGPEWDLEQEHRRDGIPLSRHALDALAATGGPLGVPIPV